MKNDIGGVITVEQITNLVDLLEIEDVATRQYIAHYEGQKLQSLCLGLSARQRQLTKRTPELVGLCKVLHRWLRQDKRWDDFTFSSITINKHHAAKLHRDKGNMGPSVIRTLGSFEGGELLWWPGDDRKLDISLVPDANLERIDTSDFAIFDGNCAHGVTNFTGTRFSVIFFTTWTHDDTQPYESLLELWDLDKTNI